MVSQLGKAKLVFESGALLPSIPFPAPTQPLPSSRPSAELGVTSTGLTISPRTSLCISPGLVLNAISNDHSWPPVFGPPAGSGRLEFSHTKLPHLLHWPPHGSLSPQGRSLLPCLCSCYALPGMPFLTFSPSLILGLRPEFRILLSA